MHTRVLSIEDDDKLSELLGLYLRRYEGWDIQQTRTLEDGLNFLRTRDQRGGFDVILLDLVLPDSTGVDTLKAIRRMTDTPVIILTSIDFDDDEKEDLFKMGAFRVMFKTQVRGSEIASAIVDCASQTLPLVKIHEPIIKLRAHGLEVNSIAGSIAVIGGVVIILSFVVSFGVDLWLQLPTGKYEPNLLLVGVISTSFAIILHHVFKKDGGSRK